MPRGVRVQVPPTKYALVAELVYVIGLGPVALAGLRVRISPSAYASVVELAYTAVSKTATIWYVGSSPTGRIS